MSYECYMNVTFRFCFRSPLKSLKLPVFKGLSTDLGSHSFLHISFYPLYKLELFVQGVSGKMPLKIKHVSTGCQMGGIFENEIYGFNLFPGNNVIKFTPSESVKIYTLIVKAYGN